MHKIMKLFTPTFTLHASIRCFSTNAGGEAKYWLPLSGEGMLILASRLSPPHFRGRARVGVQYLHRLNTFKLFVTCLTALLASALTMPLQAAPADDFGRLFSRQNERKNLDILRQNQKLKVATPQDSLQSESTADATPPELPDPITMQGYVKRSDGSSTLWINNKAVREDSAVDDVQIGRLNKRVGSVAGSDSLNVNIPATGKHIHLKAGQVYEPETNQIKELKLLEKEKRLSLEESGVIGDEVSP